MINHPSMTARGRRIAGIIAILVVFALPKRVECSYPGEKCFHPDKLGRGRCSDYEVEPFVFFLLESVFDRDIGFAYSHGEECR